MQHVPCILNSLGITGSVVFSGLIGALVGGLLAGRYLVWQTREAAKHELRSIVIRMGIHVQQCKGIGGNRTEAWTVYMEDAIAAYQRYRALILPWQRSRLDRGWTRFQGTDPNGSTPYAYAPMMDFAACLDRIRKILDVLD
jgi:hypothetical protein